MSYAPKSILDVRHLIQKHIPSLSNVEIGIVGDDSHANSGTSYHLGKDALRSDAYSVDESARDRNGLSNAASALDIGTFTIKTTIGTYGTVYNLRSFSKWLVEQCQKGAEDTKDIREIIYSPDGIVVRRWDRLGKRLSGDSSHLTHTHISWFRDSENRKKTGVFERWFNEIKGENMLTAEDKAWIRAELVKIVAAVWDHTETDPVDPEVERRMGGDMRWMEARAKQREDQAVKRHQEILLKLAAK